MPIKEYSRAHKKVFVDLIYSCIAYALPTIVLQFVVQPMIANRLSADENGLFIALFNVIKLIISVLIIPLANLRLLRKQECEKVGYLNSFFNLLFIIALLITSIVGLFINGFYTHFDLSYKDSLLFLIILILMAFHDYYMVAFRLVLNYKKIVFDNCFIILGYGIGVFFFIKTGVWELIFIIGYSFGSVFILLNTDLWKRLTKERPPHGIIKQYIELSASSMLGMTSVYCDRLIIYPILGGFEVSVYNSAAVVSKAISVISAPLRNVLLSYIVNHNGLVISKKQLNKVVPLGVPIIVLIYFLFWGISVIACRLLYPQYVSSALSFIPIITLSMITQTIVAILNIALLRFAETKLQTIISAVKLSVYLLSVLFFAIVFNWGLMGFCVAVLLADSSSVLIVSLCLKNKITIIE